jgi:hypothetical protein
VPDWQVVPEPHTRPQTPQLALSLWRLRQVPAQTVRPAPQVIEGRHVPPKQTSVVPQRLPQRPQSSGAKSRSAQYVPQDEGKPGQSALQRPAWQICPPPQRTPQAPQFIASVWTFVHEVPHTVWPEAQMP